MVFQEQESVYRMLDPWLAEWFKKTFQYFTLPQLKGIPLIHARENVLISAPTGTGKTLSGFTTILNELTILAKAGQLEDKVYCIYISPLKALSNDIEKNLEIPLNFLMEKAKKEGKKLGVKIAVRTGDTSTTEKAKMLKKPPHILITTPESLAIIINSPKFQEKLSSIQWVIVDEIHAIAENKRGTHLSLSLERLELISPNYCRIGLSATISPLQEIASFLTGFNGKQKRDCKIVNAMFEKKLDLTVLSPVPDLVETTQKEMHEKMYELLDKLIQSHRSTIVFTNTRNATERVVNHLKEKFPKKYLTNLGAHHSSISRKKRLQIEKQLKEGKLKACVSSTSLELGIDIGYVDLVVLLSSPKSIARALQRIGRSGHKLHETIKGRLIAMDRDDLVESVILTKNARERKIDKIKTVKNALDVLAQHIFGMAVSGPISEKKVYETIKNSYAFHELEFKDFQEVLSYLAGEYTSLENRHVYAKIWRDKETSMIGKKGKLARVIYMTNIGTIPDEAKITVKIGREPIGSIDEAFLERLKKGDVFVLGGEKYVFLYSRGMTIQVRHEEKRPPTVPSWVSEMLPLSFDLAMEIQRFRKLMHEKISLNPDKKTTTKFLESYLGVDTKTAKAITNYFFQQHEFLEIPHHKKLLVEQIKTSEGTHYIFHSLFGRRTNDCLSRIIAYIISKLERINVEVSITDNGFMLTVRRKIPIEKSLKLLERENIRKLAELSINDSEILQRRFRHCSARSLMILRNYKGKQKSVARQQMSSRLLFSAVKELDKNFCILKEARREVLEDVMDIKATQKVIEMIRKKETKIKIVVTENPSPFALNIYAQGRSDLIRIENRIEFIRRMHKKILEKISEKKWI